MPNTNKALVQARPTPTIIVHDVDGLRVGMYNARVCTIDDSDCWVGWVRVHGRLEDASGSDDGDDEASVRRWCERQVAIRVR
jgi:hypothetical protein